MFTLTFIHQNALCVSLRFNRSAECISFLNKHLQSILNLALITSIFALLSFLAHYSHL